MAFRLPPRAGMALLIGWTAAVGCRAESFLDSLFKRDLYVVTATDMAPAGAHRSHPTADHPVYYFPVSSGFHDFGGLIAGDKLPSKDAVNRVVMRVLAGQGYKPATDRQPPELLIMWTWGTMRVDRVASGSMDLPDPQANRFQMLHFLGADKVGLGTGGPSPSPDAFGNSPGLSFLSADADALSQLSEDDLYVIAIRAYDYRDAEHKKHTLVWTTKISCPSRGFWLPEAMPAMLAIAAPYIGRDTPTPVRVHASDQFRPEVTIGDPTLVQFLDRSPSAPAPAPAKH